MKISILVFLAISIILLSCEWSKPTTEIIESPTNQSLVWQQGYLDIHHINTGGGDAAFFIFPDGTTMLFDAGDMNVKGFNKKYAPLKATSLHPSDSLTAGQWIVNYIHQVFPEDKAIQIDYALISHFHSDHYGNVRSDTRNSSNGNYKLTGMTEIGDLIPIGIFIDRNAPDYNYPVDLRKYYKEDKTFQNYLKFTSHHSTTTDGFKSEQLKVGSNDQIILLNTPDQYDFRVQNVKSNGTIWTGEESDTFEYLQKDSVVNENGKFNENPLSLALKISYGKFDYFTGGDMTGLQGYGKPEWFDVETPVAKAVGKVEVTTLNHHGNRDATNENFVKALAPRVVVQQSWCSDHPGQEVYERLISKSLYEGDRDIFATNIHEETKVTLGPWFVNAYNSMEGHVMIRVMPEGKEYYVFVLDDHSTNLKLKSKFGPYNSN